MPQTLHVLIKADDDTVAVTVTNDGKKENLGPYRFGPTGSDLQRILEVCGIEAEYEYRDRDGKRQ